MRANKFVIVNINNFYWKENIDNTYSRTIINSILNDYDTQIIKLPILNGNTSETVDYRINSIIIRHGDDVNHGHYIILLRDIKGIGWNLVSDTHTTHMDTLVQPIIGVYILCLESKI